MSENTVTDWTVLNEAHAALLTVVRGLTAADLDRKTPCAEWTVTQVIQHAAGDQLAYVAALGAGEGPAENPFAPSGTLTGSPAELVEPAVAAAAAAWAAVPADAQAVAVPLPPHTMTAELGAGACALDAAVHAWDLAVASGQSSPLTPELAARLLPVAHAIADPLRGFAFADALSGNGSDEVGALLRYLGRDPHWQG
ncbi:TIGR03086 family metal-binding protein [Nocardia sp. NPDC048505]|uniref:TIGR03086 family metal-binding protein n=1 Tax=unclassified Nocardia TaxID=2637762 RepID=UPI0033D6BDA4